MISVGEKGEQSAIVSAAAKGTFKDKFNEFECSFR